VRWTRRRVRLSRSTAPVDRGDAWFRQEYLCEFLDDGSQMFDRDLVMAILEEGEPLRL
jgi:hypothetical protein